MESWPVNASVDLQRELSAPPTLNQLMYVFSAVYPSHRDLSTIYFQRVKVVFALSNLSPCNGLPPWEWGSVHTGFQSNVLQKLPELLKVSENLFQGQTTGNLACRNLSILGVSRKSHCLFCIVCHLPFKLVFKNYTCNTCLWQTILKIENRLKKKKKSYS